MRFIGLQKKLELKSILASIDKPLMLCGVFILYYLEKLSIENVLSFIFLVCFVIINRIMFHKVEKNYF